MDSTGSQNIRISPRRSQQIQPAGKRWRFPDKKFVHQKQVTLKHTNAEGNTYYDNYLTWHGEAREALLLSHPNVEEFLRDYRHVKMITHSIYQKFVRDSFFGDVIRIEVTSAKVKHCSFVLVYRFFNAKSGVLLGEGWQKICFADIPTARLTTVPPHILDLIEPLQEEVKESFFSQRC